MALREVEFLPTDELLRDDVRRLGAMVGAMLAEQQSPAFLDLVEAVRRAAIARREEGAPVTTSATRMRPSRVAWRPCSVICAMPA